jgi:hypothetical protein
VVGSIGAIGGGVGSGVGGVRDGGGVGNGDGGNSLVHNGSGVRSVSGLGHDGVESVVGISGVVDGAGGAIGLKEGVLALDNISITVLGLALDITGVGIVDGVLELVLGVALQKWKNLLIFLK